MFRQLDRKHKLLKWVRNTVGPLIVLTLLFCFEFFSFHHWAETLLAPVSLILVILLAFVIDFIPALAMACLTWIYVAFIIPTHLARASGAQMYGRQFLWAVLLLGVTILIRILRRRLEVSIKSEFDEKENSNRALRISEERTRAMIDFAYDAFIGMNRQGLVTDWNRQAEKMFGWSAEEAIGKLLGDLIVPPIHREAHARGLKHFLATGQGPVLNHRLEMTGLHRLGYEVPIELTIYPIEQGDEILFGSFLHDISEKIRNQQLQATQLKVGEILTKSNTQKEALRQLLPSICKEMKWCIGEVWLFNPDHSLLECAEIWPEQSLGLQKFIELTQNTVFRKGEGLPGRVWNDRQTHVIQDLSTDQNFPRAFVANEVGLKGALAFPLMASENQILGVMAFYTSRNNVLEQSLLDLVSNIGSYVGLFLQRKYSEEKLSYLYQELEYKVEERTRQLAEAFEQAKIANRLKDEFLATVSHELRTPLGVIIGHSDLLLMGGMNEDEVALSLDAIRRNARVQTQIISDLLDVSRVITGKMQLSLNDVRLPLLIQESVESIRVAAAAKEIELQISLDPDVAIVRGDSGRLQQILWNLLSNAVKFTPKQGLIQVRLQRVQSKAQIQVIDNGKGIDASFLPYVFERFRQEDSTTTRKYGGLGLGLAIVRHLVEAHGGTVSAQSEGHDKGTCFTVSLPLAASQQATSHVRGTTLESRDSAWSELKKLEGLKILVVDDEKDNRSMLGLVFKQAGAQVRLAESAEQAIEFFKESTPQILVSDISMPGKDGYELMREIRLLSVPEGKNVPAIALTAHVREDEKQRAFQSGFNLHISKPIEPHELVQKVFQFWQGQREL